MGVHIILKVFETVFLDERNVKVRGWQKQIALPNIGGVVQSVQAQIEEIKTTIQEGKILPSALV